MFDGSLIADIAYSIKVSERCMPTTNTGKRRLVRTVALVHIPTHITGLTGIARIDRNHQHVCTCCLVRDERPELSVPVRMWVNSFAATARRVPLALATSCLAMRWLVSAWKRRCLPLICFKRRFALFVPTACRRLQRR